MFSCFPKRCDSSKRMWWKTQSKKNPKQCCLSSSSFFFFLCFCLTKNKFSKASRAAAVVVADSKLHNSIAFPGTTTTTTMMIVIQFLWRQRDVARFWWDKQIYSHADRFMKVSAGKNAMLLRWKPALGYRVFFVFPPWLLEERIYAYCKDDHDYKCLWLWWFKYKVNPCGRRRGKPGSCRIWIEISPRNKTTWILFKIQ